MGGKWGGRVVGAKNGRGRRKKWSWSAPKMVVGGGKEIT